MNILPSFSPYPSSSLPLTKTGKKGTARDNEQKKSKIMVAEAKPSREAGAMRGVNPPRRVVVGALNRMYDFLKRCIYTRIAVLKKV